MVELKTGRASSAASEPVPTIAPRVCALALRRTMNKGKRTKRLATELSAKCAEKTNQNSRVYSGSASPAETGAVPCERGSSMRAASFTTRTPEWRISSAKRASEQTIRDQSSKKDAGPRTPGSSTFRRYRRHHGNSRTWRTRTEGLGNRPRLHGNVRVL